MKLPALLLGLGSTAQAHTLFTTLFINGENQGDGTCVRMPYNDDTATSPVYPITGVDMACGQNGNDAVAFVCPAPSGATLTFEFRLWPDAQEPGSIDPGHKGPCAVYMKKVDDVFNDKAAGSGWFKIWEDGYNEQNGEWCVDKLVNDNGLLSVELPESLPSGYYLVRSEILALHYAHRGDPQFYIGCAQIFIQGGRRGSLDIPEEYTAEIPGYVDGDTIGVTFDIYQEPLPAYTVPGPRVYTPSRVRSHVAKSAKSIQKHGAIPGNCILKNANWCAKPIAEYDGENACWDAVNGCYAQSKRCWTSAPPSGSANCYTWSDYCKLLDETCDSGDFKGPPAFEGEEKYADMPGDIPDPWDNVSDGDAGGEDGGGILKGGKKGRVETVTVSIKRPSRTSAVTPERTSTATDEVDRGSGEGGDGDTGDDGGGGDNDGEDEDSGDSNGKDENKNGGGNLVISKNGSCGSDTNQTCMGSAFGDCCSAKGWCGRKSKHCECGCQADFGGCWDSE